MVNPTIDYFNEVYEREFYKVKGFVISKCRSMADVEDIVQEVFAKIFKLVDSKGVGFINNVDAMTMRIAKFEVYRYYIGIKKHRNNLPLCKSNDEGEEYDTAQFQDFDIEDKYITDETVAEVWEFLKSKPEHTQKIFSLYYYCDKPIREIATIMKTSESYVKHELYRNLKRIRTLYQKEGEVL
jgi:RNA polymerase sigma-70 factor (ECF subfamily)